MTSQRLLFDLPGRRARRRIHAATLAALAALALLVWLAVRQFADHGQLASEKWSIFGQWPVIRYLLGGLLFTMEAAAVSAAFAVPLGMLAAFARLARTAPLRAIATAFVEAFRAVPILLLIFFFLLALPRYGIVLPRFWQLVLPLVLGNAAVLAEIFRAGILSLDRGQAEAAYSIGLTYWQAMLLVVVPQAVRRLLPALLSQLVTLLKGTTLGYVVSFDELLNRGKILGEFNHALVQTYLVVALIYVAVNATLSWLAREMEARQRRRYGGATVSVGAATADVSVSADASAPEAASVPHS